MGWYSKFLPSRLQAKAAVPAPVHATSNPIFGLLSMSPASITPYNAWLLYQNVAPFAKFVDLIADRRVDSGASATLGDLPPGTYFWRVAGVNASGEPGPWGESGGWLRRPETPAIELLQADSRALRLTWQTRPGERYRLQVARDAAFSQPVVDTELDGGQFAFARPASGTYYARLQVLDVQGVADPVGATHRFEVPVPLWLKMLLGSTVLLPLLL